MATQLIGEDGKLKPFEQWERDTASIGKHHVENWLKTEYSTAVRRARLAAEWRQFEREKDILPNIEWMKTTAVTPGEDHKPFWGVILPIGHPFWNAHRPGDRWGCKCGWRSTDADIVPPSGDAWSNPVFAPADGLENNPGKDAMLFSFAHPYFAAAYWAYKKLKPVVEKFVSDQIKKRRELKNYTKDAEAGKRLLIHKKADTVELGDNIRTGRALINNFSNMRIRIREHVRDGGKNPEYEINGLIADAKRVKSPNGITNGFLTAKEQKAEIVIIDFDKHLFGKNLSRIDVAKRISWRKKDFESGEIKECYIVHNEKSILITKDNYSNRGLIVEQLTKLGM